jgi:hypothetical protein
VANDDIQLSAFPASIAAALGDRGGALALTDGDFAALLLKAEEMRGTNNEPIALEILALCAKCTRLLGSAAAMACGQMLVIIAMLTNDAYAEAAAHDIATAAHANVVGGRTDNKPVATAPSMANTPLGVFHALKSSKPNKP